MTVRTVEDADPAGDGLSIVDDPERGRYEARLGADVAAFSEYRPLRGRVAFIHTVVEPAFEGRGIGSRLARAILDDLRARGLLITPYCEFIAGYIGRHPEYEDLVSWGRRDASGPS